jgi:hypothetical protein
VVALAEKAEQLDPLVARVRDRLEHHPVVPGEVVGFRESAVVMCPGDANDAGELLARALGSLKRT